MTKMIRHRITPFGWSLIRKCGLGQAVICFHPKSYLVKLGWFRSFRQGIPLDTNGSPLPWLPYPFIDFLSSRIDKSMKVFEFGTGYSTLWFCQRTNSVLSVENKPSWQRRILSLAPPNGRIVLQRNPADYARTILGNGFFDIVFVDGINRTECLRQAMKCLTERGVILADDSGREDFRTAWPSLASAGFREIVFSGITPSHFVPSQASVLYRNANCLGI